MSHLPRFLPAATHPEGVFLAGVATENRRVVTNTDGRLQNSATALADELWELADLSSTAIVLDLMNVDWIDSGACAVLIRFWGELRSKGRPLVLAVSESVRETFVITGLIRIISCHTTLEAAIEAARQAAIAPEIEKGS